MCCLLFHMKQSSPETVARIDVAIATSMNFPENEFIYLKCSYFIYLNNDYNNLKNIA